MSGTIPPRYVEFHAKTGFLSPIGLINRRHADFEPSRSGLKRTHNGRTSKELAEVEMAYVNLRSQLSVSRIERLAGRALATYHEDFRFVEVLKKDGKFENFGYSHMGKFYLEYYETLFLLELNRLQLEYKGIILSIEQAYNLLLGSSTSDRYNHYIVYSCLSRLGYIIVRHVSSDVSRDDCIWAITEEKISHKPIKDNIRNSSLFKNLKNQMNTSTRKIMCQEFVSNSYDSKELKNNLSRQPPFDQGFPVCSTGHKRVCLTSNQSLVDILKTDSTCIKFQQIFQKFDIVKIDKSVIPTNCGDVAPLKITFDLHMPNKGFRKSCLSQTPYFNVVVLSVNSLFPTHNDIFRLQSKVPILIISVGESRQIQAFLYYISS